MPDHVYWWLQYLKLFTLNTPFGMPVKFTIGVSAYDGERLAAAWKMEPYDVVDAYQRPCKQIQTEDKLIAFEWLVPPPPQPRSNNPMTWGGMTSDPSRARRSSNR
jgi:hypothetical protein